MSKAPCLHYFDINAPVLLQVGASEYGLGAALLQPAIDPTGSNNIQWQPVTYSSRSLSLTEQLYAQIEREILAIVHTFHKFNQLLFGKSEITVHSDHQPLETIFKHPLASALCCLQSMILADQWYSFRVEYQKGFSVHVADTLSQAPLPTTSHKQVHDELVYQVEFESTTPQLSGFQDATLRDIRAAASSDPEQIALHALVLTGWPNDKLAVPKLALPYWSVHHSLSMMVFFSSRIASSSHPHFEQTSCTNSMPPIGVLRLLSAMLIIIVCSGLATYICANPVRLVLNMRINTLKSHSNQTQYPLYHGNLSLRTSLNSRVLHIW